MKTASERDMQRKGEVKIAGIYEEFLNTEQSQSIQKAT